MSVTVSAIVPIVSPIREALIERKWTGGSDRGDGYTFMWKSFADSAKAHRCVEIFRKRNLTAWVDERPEPPQAA